MMSFMIFDNWLVGPVFMLNCRKGVVKRAYTIIDGFCSYIRVVNNFFMFLQGPNVYTVIINKRRYIYRLFVGQEGLVPHRLFIGHVRLNKSGQLQYPVWTGPHLVGMYSPQRRVNVG